eukprot:5321980-Pyramimonas_sp.AAC.1
MGEARGARNIPWIPSWNRPPPPNILNTCKLRLQHCDCSPTCDGMGSLEPHRTEGTSCRRACP